MAGLAVPFVFVVAGVLLAWKGSEYFERAAGRLSKHYGLPVVVHGAIETVRGI